MLNNVHICSQTALYLAKSIVSTLFGGSVQRGQDVGLAIQRSRPRLLIAKWLPPGSWVFNPVMLYLNYLFTRAVCHALEKLSFNIPGSSLQSFIS